MNILCPNPCVACPPSIGGGIGPTDPDFPFVNVSSEAPDVDNFIGRRFLTGLPPIGGPWTSIGCLGFCFSSESQQAADLCAQQQAVLCQGNNWPTWQPNSNPASNGNYPFLPQPTATFNSNPQTCSFACPDGSLFNFTVAPGLFTAFSQAAADLQAYTFACQQAVNNRVCMGSLTPSLTCASSLYNGSLVVSSQNTPITFTIIGDLPDGLLLVQNETTAFIQGTPTTPGDYAFTMVATDPIGNFMQKAIELTVFGISNDTELSGGSVGAPYSVVLATAGTVSGSITFFVSSGALPDGLSLNSATGEISGTPTTEATTSFTVTAASGSLSCAKQLSIEVLDACPFPSSFAWFDINGPTYVPVAEFTTLTFANGSIQVIGFAEPEVLPDPTPSGQYDTKMSFVYTGPGFDLHFRGTHNVVGNNNSGFFIQAWDGDVGTGNLINTIFIDPFTVASPYDEIITIPSPVNGYVTVWMFLTLSGCSQGGACSGITTTINYNMTIGC